MQRWSVYFGDASAGSANFDAYDVGAAFVYFLLDRFGEAKLLGLFADIAKTRTLAESARNVVARTADELDAEWQAYLAAIEVKVPHVVLMDPPNGAMDVRVDLVEARVSFDTDMSPACRSTITPPCDQGLCFEHAQWKDARTLAIAAHRRLVAGRAYEIDLGSRGCLLRTTAGAELPRTKWRFVTRDVRGGS
jgi:hypothetical protein